MKKLILLSLVLIVLAVANEAVAKGIGLTSISATNAFRIRGRNIREDGDDSITVDVILANLTGTWYLVSFVSLGHREIPVTFLMGPYQEKEFRNVILDRKENLVFDCDRDNVTVKAILAIDVICRGIFSEPLSLEEFDRLFADTGFALLEQVGRELINDTSGANLGSMISEFDQGDNAGALESLAKFILALKGTQKQIWKLAVKLWGERDSVIRAVGLKKLFSNLIQIIGLPKKYRLLKDIAVASHRSPTWDNVQLVATDRPFLELTELIEVVSPKEPPYYANDIIEARFTVANNGNLSIMMQQLTIGVVGPPFRPVVNFPSVTGIFLGIGEKYTYEGKSQLPEPGIYHLYWMYQDQDNKWSNKWPFKVPIELQAFLSLPNDEMTVIEITEPDSVVGEVITNIEDILWFENIGMRLQKEEIGEDYCYWFTGRVQTCMLSQIKSRQIVYLMGKDSKKTAVIAVIFERHPPESESSVFLTVEKPSKVTNIKGESLLKIEQDGRKVFMKIILPAEYQLTFTEIEDGYKTEVNPLSEADSWQALYVVMLSEKGADLFPPASLIEGYSTDTNLRIVDSGDIRFAGDEMWCKLNDPPVADSKSVTTNKDNPLEIILTGSDPDSDTLTYTVVTNPSYGSLSGTAPSLTYTPQNGFSGSDSFTFKVNDGTVDSNIATVSITVPTVGMPGTPIHIDD